MSRVVASLVALLCAGSAFAGPMLKVGPAPESSFTGTWRFIGARSAPWAPPRKLTKADAPLLEYAIKLTNGAVEGPPPFSCKNAGYTEGVSYHDELFGGKLKTDKDFALARKIGLSQGEIDTERVVCNGKVFDFYFTDAAQYVLGIGDVIYTLEQPTGMEPDQYKPGYTGPSIDCTKARTVGEKLICTDASLAKSDRSLGAAWRKLKQSISPESFARFQAAQRAWLAYEMKDCGGSVTGPMPAAGGETNAITECLGDAFDKRAELLSGLKTGRAGALVIEPDIRFRSRANPNTEETDIYPVMRGGPQAAAFNAYIAKALKLNGWRMDDKSLFQFDVADGMKLHAHRSYSVVRFDAHIVSLDIVMSDYAGGHDEQSSDTTLTWNVATSRPVTLADVFAPGKGWKKFVIAYCAKDLKRQTDKDGLTDDLTDADMNTSVSDNGNWAWNKDHATLGFLISMGGGGPESSYTVDIPYRLLKPFMKPDAPVMPR